MDALTPKLRLGGPKYVYMEGSSQREPTYPFFSLLKYVFLAILIDHCPTSFVWEYRSYILYFHATG